MRRTVLECDRCGCWDLMNDDHPEFDYETIVRTGNPDVWRDDRGWTYVMYPWPEDPVALTTDHYCPDCV